jgi:succinate-acetate transporter protein
MTDVLAYYRTCWHVSRVEERSLKIIMLTAVVLFVVGAIAEARDTHTVWGQGGTFWMLLGFAAVALEFAAPRYAGRLRR